MTPNGVANCTHFQRIIFMIEIYYIVNNLKTIFKRFYIFKYSYKIIKSANKIIIIYVIISNIYICICNRIYIYIYNFINNHVY